MSSLIVVDRPLCCSSGLCGPSPDPILMRFADDVAWLFTNGVAVERINPSEDPERFLTQPAVLSTFETHGNACLPIVLSDGEIVSTGHYPARDELARLAGVDEAADSFITLAVRELIGLGAAIAAHCEPCFRSHYAEARKLGVSHDDMARAVAVAQAVKDTPARALLNLADRYLSPKPIDAEPAQAASCCGSPAAEKATAPAAGDAPAPPSSGCCC